MIKYLKSNFNYFVYVFLRRYYFLIVRKDTLVKRLNYLEKLSFFAFNHFPLLLSDKKLELELVTLGKENLSNWNIKLETKSNKQQRILHIATEIYDIGGHTRVLGNWIKNESERDSYIILTSQYSEIKTNILDEIIDRTKNSLILETNLNHIEKSEKILHFIAENNINTVVFHTHPFDVIPSLIGALSNFPVSILFNHSDHTFGLGVLTNELFLELTAKGKETSLKFRGNKNSEVLNLPLQSLPKYKEIIRDNNSITLVSMASSWKFKPFEDLDFFNVYVPFLRKYKHVTLKIIGVKEEDYFKFTNLEKPQNLELLGTISNPKQVLSNADYFIEMFPFCSYLSALDSISSGLMPVFSYDHLIVSGAGTIEFFPFLKKEIKYKTKGEYIEFIENNIINLDYKKKNIEKVVHHLINTNYNNWYSKINLIVGKLIKSKIEIEQYKNKKLTSSRAKKYARFQLVNEIKWQNFVQKQKLKSNFFLAVNFIFLYWLNYVLSEKINKSKT